MFLCGFFLRSKMATRRLEAAAPANEMQASIALLFSSSRKLRNRWTSRISQLPMQSRTPLARSRSGFESWSKKWKRKDEVTQQWRKIHIIRNRLSELHGSTMSFLCLSNAQASRSFRCSCVEFTTQYKERYDKQKAGHRLHTHSFEKKNAQSPVYFPTTEWCKNHWIAW